MSDPRRPRGGTAAWHSGAPARPSPSRAAPARGERRARGGPERAGEPGAAAAAGRGQSAPIRAPPLT